MVVVVGPLAAAKAELHPARVAMAVQTMPGEAFVSEPNLKQFSNEARITGFLIRRPLCPIRRLVEADALLSVISWPTTSVLFRGD